MSTKNYTTMLLDMEDVVLKNIKEDARELTIEIELAQKVQLCSACGAATSRIHDYHHRMIRDLALRGKRTTLHYRRRRYICLECGKKFAEGRSSPRHAASPGAISASLIGQRRKPSTCCIGAAA